MAHFRGANNTSFEKTESSSQNYSSSSSSNTSSTVTRGYQAAQGGVMDNFGGVRYAPAQQQQQPPVQYQQQPQYQQLPPPPQQQGPPQGYRQESPPPPQQQQQPVPIERAPAPAAAKPKTSFKKNNVRIVGGKLFHVADDVEGPISIQFIGEHPDGGNRPYHVAKSTYPPPEKPRNAVSAGGQRFHFI